MIRKDDHIAKIFAERVTKVLSTRPHGAQKELALAIGEDPSYLNNVCTGRRTCPEDLRRKIARQLGYKSYDHFLFGDLFGQGPAGIDRSDNDDPLLGEFIALYRQYGSPAFLQSCIQRLQDIKVVIEK